jgi:hypothetical protein
VVYPQVTGAGVSLTKVNKVLRRVVTAHQQTLSRSCPTYRTIKGIFRTYVDRSLISASTALVSVLLPTLEVPPGGSEGETWLSVTVEVPSGSIISFKRMITDRPADIDALMAVVRKEAARQSVCVRNSLDDPQLGANFARGFSRISTDDFVLTADGLVIGFANGVVAGPACGRIKVRVPYRLIEPHLNEFGRTLVGVIRPPR